MSSQLAVARGQATAGDPRRPTEVVEFKTQPKGDAEKMPNGTLLLALFCGMAAMMLKIKYLTWVSLAFVCSAVARADANFEWTQLIQTLMFNVLGLGTTYVLPHWQKQKAPPPAPTPQPTSSSPFS